VDSNEGGLQRINELHPSYMAMQYPFLFPYGKDGFRLGIFRKSVNVVRLNTTNYVTMMKYYAYQLQKGQGEGHTLIYGGHLFQQFVVDAYTYIKGI
jgi:hypothetical protein